MDSPPTTSFRELMARELRLTECQGRQVSFGPGQTIFREGDPGDGLYVLEEGRVSIWGKVAGGEQRLLGHVEPGACFGEMAVLDGEPRSADAIAEDSTRLTFFDREAVVGALETCPEWLLYLVRELSGRVRKVDRRYLDEVLQAERFSVIGQFAQGIVHDFKNPLNIIAWAGELAAAEDAEPAHREEAVKSIRKQVERLTTMINEVLEFTRGNTNAASLARTDYAEFLRGAFPDLQAGLAGKPITAELVSCDPGAFAMIDARRLLHVFYNLVNNAADFMPRGGAITIRTRALETEIITEVQDTGPGIAKEMLGKLFEPFSTHGKARGTGLGLAICKRIIEDHHGRISARNEPGAGAVFTFTLPRLA